MNKVIDSTVTRREVVGEEDRKAFFIKCHEIINTMEADESVDKVLIYGVAEHGEDPNRANTYKAGLYSLSNLDILDQLQMIATVTDAIVTAELKNPKST